MNNKIIIIFLCTILAAVIVFGSISISSLNMNIDELKAQINNNNAYTSQVLSGIESGLGSMKSDIETSLHKQASIISSYNISYGKSDAGTLIGDVTVTVIPKEYSESTSAVLYMNNEGVNMVRSGNAFTGTATVKINERYAASITFSNNEVNKSESLPEEIDYGLMLKPSLQVTFDYSVYNDNTQDYGNLSYSFYSRLGERAVSAKIVAVYNGQEKWSQTITDPNSGEIRQLQYVSGKELSEVNSYGEIYEQYDVYVEVLGSFGFTYRSRFDENGDNYVSIYDKDGKEIVFNP